MVFLLASGFPLRSSLIFILSSRFLHDVLDPPYFNFAAGIYLQARSRSCRQEYSQIFLLFVLFIQCYYLRT